MKILFLAAADNYHTQKWCKFFTSQKHEVHVISFTEATIENTKVHYIDCGVKPNNSDFKKIKYLISIKKVRKIIKEIKPDVINAHYASSYGMIAALTCPNNYILSIWGADIYDFPKKSILHKLYIKYVLKKAKDIFSTSNAMADEIKKYTTKRIQITPFGVDIDLFNPNKRTRNQDNNLVIGTIKSLTPKYGIDVLLKSTKLIKEKTNINIYLKIAGKGEYETQYKELAKELGIDDITTWLGFIPQDEVAKEWANMDIAIIPSVLESESFGVSAVEAEACGTPVIISDIPGLMESTNPNITSLVFKRGNIDELADTIIYLYKNKDKMDLMGKNGREFAVKNFEYNNCFKHIENLFFDYTKE